MRFAQRTGLRPWQCRYCSDPIVQELGGKLYSAHDGTRHDQLICAGPRLMREIKNRQQSYCRECELIVFGGVFEHSCRLELRDRSRSAPVVSQTPIAKTKQRPANVPLPVQSTSDLSRLTVSASEVYDR